jgi:hypothetical protein
MILTVNRTSTSNLKDTIIITNYNFAKMCVEVVMEQWKTVDVHLSGFLTFWTSGSCLTTGQLFRIFRSETCTETADSDKLTHKFRE